LSDSLRALLLVGTGGFLGAVGRYLTALAVTRGLGLESFVATAAANLSGCAAIGAAVAWFELRAVGSDELRLLLVVGFLGAYTTFSTYGLESLELLRGGRTLSAVLNLLVQPACGLAAVLLGRLLAHRLLSP
jgi:CrcB protein